MGSSSWAPPWHCTVIGAAHRRKGVVCQDASLVRQLPAPAGQTLQLLAVADGHGGERYRYSDTGSRLACEQAAEAVQAALQTTPLADQGAWQRQLSHALPTAIQDLWLRAIQRHWQQNPDPSGQPFCPSLYGSTLGLVLLAPTWWGCTGLGDWDLVRVGGDGTDLLSEEHPQPGGGEATASLCLAEAAVRWAERAQLQPIPSPADPFALLISTDGVRKSCATDQDFLELCSQIVPLGDGLNLAEGLAEISAGGSGDDLSIAVGCWGSSSTVSTLVAGSRSLSSAASLLLLVPLLLALGAAAWWASSPLPNQTARRAEAVAPPQDREPGPEPEPDKPEPDNNVPVVASGISQSDAMDLVNQWLSVKQQIFAPPFDTALADQLVAAGPLWTDLTKPDGSIQWLRNNNSYYSYNDARVNEVIRFIPSETMPAFGVSVTEDAVLHSPRGSEPSRSSATWIYTFKQEGGSWKLWDYRRQ